MFRTLIICLSLMVLLPLQGYCQGAPAIKTGFAFSSEELAKIQIGLTNSVPLQQKCYIAWCVCENARDRIAYAYTGAGGDPGKVADRAAQTARRYGGCFKEPSIEVLTASPARIRAATVRREQRRLDRGTITGSNTDFDIDMGPDRSRPDFLQRPEDR